MKTVKRREVDRLIRYAKRWWSPLGNADDQHALSLQTDVMSAETKTDGYAWRILISSMVMRNGLCEDVSYEQVYKILNILGWEVVD